MCRTFSSNNAYVLPPPAAPPYMAISAGGRKNTASTTPSVAGNKITRALALSAQVQAGNVYLLEGEWNEWFLNEMNGFPDLLHDDVVDAASGIFNFIAASGSWNGLAD